MCKTNEQLLYGTVYKIFTLDFFRMLAKNPELPYEYTDGIFSCNMLAAILCFCPTEKQSLHLQ